MTGLRHATVLVNPAARGVSERFDGTRIVRYLDRHGIEARLLVPSSPANATHEARISAGRGDDILFVVGGDGSVRDAALGLAGSETALAAVPAGTVNIWAREAHIPAGLRPALDAHINGQSVHMDLGRAGDQCFLLMAGVGWDAEIARRVPATLKRAFGDVAYMLQAVRMAPSLRARPARWIVDGRVLEDQLVWMIIGNTRLYGGRVHLTPAAVIDDGQLDILALCPRRLGDAARLASRLAFGNVRGDSRVFEARSCELRLETPGFAVQLDGDYAAETPLTFRVDPGALLVSVPAGELAPIFARTHIDRRAGSV
jgi:YegS/Rv2252/BmrU family lipid kinase